MASPQPQVWFITGASAGFGLGMTEHVLAQGHIAVATLRKPEVLSHLTDKYPPSRLLVLKVDVSKPEDITAAFAAVKSVFGRLDFVFNNAGYQVIGEIETEQEEARKMFDVNFWGAAKVLTESVKFMRHVNHPRGGTVVSMSAMVGSTGYPGIGYYGAFNSMTSRSYSALSNQKTWYSPPSLEGLLKALSKEVLPEWNIKFRIIECGAFKTRMISSASYVMLPNHPAYQNGPSEILRNYLLNIDKMPAAGDPDKAVVAMYEAANAEDAPLRIPFGVDALEGIKKELKLHLEEAENAAKYSAGFTYEDGGNPFVKVAE